MKLIIFVGNIGTGKSVKAGLIAKHDAVVVSMDYIHTMLSGGVYDAYDESKKKLYQIIEMDAIERALQQGFNVVIDRTNIDKKRRARFIELGQCYDAEIICHHFGVGKKETCITNRMENSKGISKERWENVYDKIATDYEEPSLEEGFSSIVEVKPYEKTAI